MNTLHLLARTCMNLTMFSGTSCAPKIKYICTQSFYRQKEDYIIILRYMFLGGINYSERKFGEQLLMANGRGHNEGRGHEKDSGVLELFYFLTWVVVFECLFCDKLSSCGAL